MTLPSRLTFESYSAETLSGAELLPGPDLGAVFWFLGAAMVLVLEWFALRRIFHLFERHPALSRAYALFFPRQPSGYYLVGGLLGVLTAGSLAGHTLLFWYRTAAVKLLLVGTLFLALGVALAAIFHHAGARVQPERRPNILLVWSIVFILAIAPPLFASPAHKPLPDGSSPIHHELNFKVNHAHGVAGEMPGVVEIKLFTVLNRRSVRIPSGACKANDSMSWGENAPITTDPLIPLDDGVACRFRAQPGDYLEILLTNTAAPQVLDVWLDGQRYTQPELSAGEGGLQLVWVVLPHTSISRLAAVMDQAARWVFPGFLLLLAIGLILEKDWLSFGPLALIALVASGSMLALRNAWVVEDQFITLRVIENLIHGYGPNFNVGYRVQVYTHPLWMFLLALVYGSANLVSPGAHWASLYYVTAASSLGLTALTLLLVSRVGRDSIQITTLGLSLLLLSKSFMDYSLAGLENALLNVLLLLFLLLFRSDEPNGTRRLFWLFFIASCALVTRQDSLLLLLPALLYIAWEQRRPSRRWLGALAGVFPLLAWQGFSLIYYGYLVPNTAFAKLNTGIPRAALIEQGVAYIANSLRWDAITLATIVVALLTAAQRNLKGRIVGVGILGYLAYVVWIGGDFMSGRFLVAPLVLAVSLLVAMPMKPPLRTALIVLALMGLFNERSPLYSDLNYGRVRPVEARFDGAGIADERAVFFEQTALLRNDPGKGLARNHWNSWQVSPGFPADVLELGSIGIPGYTLGPDYIIADVYALADPLLSKLPVADVGNWRIGHFERTLPPGYRATLRGEGNYLANPDLAAYWEALQVVIAGDIWSRERFLTIWKFHAGVYDTLLESHRLPPP